MHSHTLARFVGLALASLVLARQTTAQDTPPKIGGQDARQLLREVAQTYRDSPAYSDQGTIEIEYVAVPASGTTKPRKVSARAQMAFVRPNKFAMTYGALRILSDGKQMTVVIDGTGDTSSTRHPLSSHSRHSAQIPSGT